MAEDWYVPPPPTPTTTEYNKKVRTRCMKKQKMVCSSSTYAAEKDLLFVKVC
jgi:hypothetical protein